MQHDGFSGAAVPPYRSGGAGTPTIAGYRVLRRLGSGASADVYLGSGGPPEQPRPVVLRCFRPGADPEEAAALVAATSETAATLLPALLDVASLDDGRTVLVVERLDGCSLAELLAARRLEAGEAVTVLAPLLGAVAALEAAGFAATGPGLGEIRFDGAGRPRFTSLPGLRRIRSEAPIAERRELRRAAWGAYAAIAEAVFASTIGGAPSGLRTGLRDALAAPQFVAPVEECERALFAWARALPVRGARRVEAEVAVASPMHRSPPVGGGMLPRLLGGGTDQEHGAEEPGAAAAAAARPRRASRPRADAGAASRSAGGRPGRRVRRDARAAALGSEEFWERLAAAADRGVPAARLRFALDRHRRPIIVGALLSIAVSVLAFTLVPAPHVAAASDPRPEPRGTVEASGEPPAADVPGRADADEAPRDREAAEPPDGPGGRAAAEADAVPDAADGRAAAVLGDDPVAAAGVLLAELGRCRADLSLDCLAAVVQAGSPIAASELAAIAAARAGGEPLAGIRFEAEAIEPIGAMGEAVLLRVPQGEPGTAPASLLVVRGEAGWRLREWFG